jgi:hypothetical protein
LISRLAGPPSPPDRVAFRRAAEDALARFPRRRKGAEYRAWLGSSSQELAVFAIWHTVPVERIEDARSHQLVIGVSVGSASTTAGEVRAVTDPPSVLWTRDECFL